MLSFKLNVGPIWHNCLVVNSEYKSEENPEFQKLIGDLDIATFAAALEKNTVIVLGGDGSMLEAIAEYYPKYTQFCGINFGNKGFLLHPQCILRQKKLSFTPRKYPLLSCRIEEEEFFAFNEFDIKAGEGKMLDVSLGVSNDYTLELIGDGLLVSSPAGSTGYNSSLGGPILQHDMHSYILTPKAPWKPKGLLPVILSEKQKLSLCTKGRAGQIEIYSDGRTLKKYSGHISANIELYREEITLFIEDSYLQTWDNRTLEEQGFLKAA